MIAEVTYRRGQDGTHADLVLMPEEAFTIQPTPLQPYDGQVAEALQRHYQEQQGGLRRAIEGREGPGI